MSRAGPGSPAAPPLARVLALSGGVGGAKLVWGLGRVLAPQRLTVVVNTGDDMEHLGLYISPDVDTVMYTLAGVCSGERGWGRAGETWSFLATVAELGGPDWFRLGDRDLATHVLRTLRLRSGESLTAVTADLCRRLGVEPAVVPMSDDPVRTIVETDEGDLPFQEYFVRRRCEPRVRGFRYAGIAYAKPSAAFRAACADHRLGAVVICPSNPYVSVDPILALPGAREAIAATRAPVVAVSPLVGGAAVSGPLGKMMTGLGVAPSNAALIEHYDGLLDALVIDRADEAESTGLESLGVRVGIADTVMRTAEDRRRLAESVLALALRRPEASPS